MIKKPYIVTLLALLISSSIFSAIINKDTIIQVPVQSEEEFLEDEIPLDSIDNDSIGHQTLLMSFDTLGVPSAGIYPCWNNKKVNPYNYDIAKLPDSIIIDFSQYVHPIKGKITSDFGWRRWRFHYGTDLSLKVGDSLQSSFDGMVRVTGYDRRGYGNYVVVRHNNGLETVYGHLSKILVTANQEVKAGQILGLGGNTGRSTGPHLHYELRYLGKNINPNDVVDFKNYCSLQQNFVLCKATFAYLHEIKKVRYHVVRKGENLGKIAQKYGVSITTLCKLNGISKSRLIRVGQKIRYT